MLLLPIRTPRLNPGDDLAGVLTRALTVQAGDILVVSSKAVATAENALYELMRLRPSSEAKRLSKQCERSPEFCELVLQELTRLRGTVINAAPGALLTEIKPRGLGTGTILIANAGLDESNAPHGFAIGWPEDPVASLKKLRSQIGKILREPSATSHQLSEKRTDSWKLEADSSSSIALILTDSCVHPRRLGVTAMALAVSGIEAFVSQKGTRDLFGKKLHITVEAVADQLATAANFLMGNAAQSTPAVIIRDHGLQLSEYEGWVPGIEPGEDLFPLFRT